MAPRKTLTERIAVVEERTRTMQKSLEILNKGHAETTDSIRVLQTNVQLVQAAIKDLKVTVNKRVAAPMTGRDRAILYGAAVTAGFSFLGLVVQAVLNYLAAIA